MIMFFDLQQLDTRCIFGQVYFEFSIKFFVPLKINNQASNVTREEE